MTDKMKIWNTLGKTDPKHTKPFQRSGGFRGTAIKPMFSYMRMTEEFGACGEGWGINEPFFQVVNANDEILVYCTVSIWHGSKDKSVFGVGGDKVLGKFSSGLKTDDEAFKKAFTDAVTNALKLIGVGADVHMGMFDDSKYVNDMSVHFSDEKPEPQDDRTEKFTPEQKSLQSVLFTELGKCLDEGSVISFIDQYSREIESLPKEMAGPINDSIENRLQAIKNKVPLKASESHNFAGVGDAIAWMKKMEPIVSGFKSTKLMDTWEEHNRPYINGLDCLSAKKYDKDGKYPRERFTDALMAKRAELTNIETSKQPIG